VAGAISSIAPTFDRSGSSNVATPARHSAVTSGANCGRAPAGAAEAESPFAGDATFFAPVFESPNPGSFGSLGGSMLGIDGNWLNATVEASKKAAVAAITR
jgi:hypothetical protein